jgi:hypothetical protein
MTTENSQYEQIGDFTRSINEHGCIIEHSRWKPSRLDEFGRCCGRKPHPYKAALRLGPGSCCFKCGREYGTDGKQRPNYAYKVDGDGNYCRDEPKGEPA